MDSLQFCYWLQGFFEISGESPYKSLSSHQVEIIKDHLALVFDKVTPTRNPEKTHLYWPYDSCGSITIKNDVPAQCWYENTNDLLRFTGGGSC